MTAKFDHYHKMKNSEVESFTHVRDRKTFRYRDKGTSVFTKQRIDLEGSVDGLIAELSALELTDSYIDRESESGYYDEGYDVFYAMGWKKSDKKDLQVYASAMEWFEEAKKIEREEKKKAKVDKKQQELKEYERLKKKFEKK